LIIGKSILFDVQIENQLTDKIKEFLEEQLYTIAETIGYNIIDKGNARPHSFVCGI
jgi:hypothetical protein